MVEVGYWKTWCGWSGSIKNLKWLKWVNEKLEVVEVGHWKSWSGWSGSLYMKWLSKQLYIMSEYWQNEVNSWSGWSGWSGLQWVLDAPTLVDHESCLLMTNVKLLFQIVFVSHKILKFGFILAVCTEFGNFEICYDFTTLYNPGETFTYIFIAEQ